MDKKNIQDGEVWLTTNEVGSLTGVPVATLKRHLKAGKYTTRRDESDGRGSYQVLLSSLPPAAQEKHAHVHPDSIRKAAPVQAPAIQSTALATTTHYDFAVYDAIWEKYSRKPAGIKAEAQRRVQILDEFDEMVALKINIGAAEAIIKQRYGDASKPTLWRWRKLVDGHQV